MMNVWGDFMAEESANTTTGATTAASAKEEPAAPSKPSSGPRSYALPIQPPQPTPGL
eukprot:CAMPEP_0201697218 /NCGR_PEP_ID=MMETSP0578-20130828/10021_1 /ASSEMBLY_ACC=CAM_ASM_000663 /TAXON_ID=267565 /ORGANISM="Skeletonema grethea, Strain CCMP 1804" /LENGTH=56 /DNA_ID=CAMNT_0048183319 /DNA_START=1 /DNA_END=168 /DNA_ORIENTATION=+